MRTRADGHVTVSYTHLDVYKRQRLHSTAHSGANDFKWLKQRLYNLGETSIKFDDEVEEGLAGSLISSFRIIKASGEAEIETNPKLRALWESITPVSYTHLDVYKRQRDACPRRCPARWT